MAGIFGGMKKYLSDPNKRLKLIFAVGAIGIALIFLSSVLSQDDSYTETEADTKQVDFDSTAEYKESVENQLTELISQIEGVDDVTVMVSVSMSEEYVYAEQTEKSKSTETDGETVTEKGEIILSDEDNDTVPVLKAVEAPKIAGAAIVCTGADDPLVRERVLNTVTAALGISSSKVSVETHK